METQEMIDEMDEEKEESLDDDPLGLNNMFGQKDSGLMEMPSIDLGLDF